MKDIQYISNNAILGTAEVFRLYPSITHDSGFKAFKKSFR